jgi:hypothetical protein
VLTPTFALAVAVLARSRARVASMVVGVVVFGALTSAAKLVLAFTGLTVTAHINDPMTVLLGSIGTGSGGVSLARGMSDALALVVGWVQRGPSVLLDIVWSYHPVVMGMAALGVARRPRPLVV